MVFPSILIELLKKLFLLPFFIQLWQLFRAEPIIAAGIFLAVYILRQTVGLKGKDSTIGVVLVLGFFAAWARYKWGLGIALLRDGFGLSFIAMGYYQLWKFGKWVWENWIRKEK